MTDLTTEEALERTVLSLLDVIEELVQGLAHGIRPQKEWADLVTQNVAAHRREILEAQR